MTTRTHRPTNVTMTTRTLTDGRIVIDSISIEALDPHGIEPADVRLAADELHATLTALVGSSSWHTHLDAAVPPSSHETRARWIARAWRNYYEPTGRSMKQLGHDLKLKHSTVRDYCSKNDPTRKDNR